MVGVLVAARGAGNPVWGTGNGKIWRRSTKGTAATRAKTFQRRRVASQTKPMQPCHPECSEGSLARQRSFAALRMTQRDGLLVEMY